MSRRPRKNDAHVDARLAGHNRLRAPRYGLNRRGGTHALLARIVGPGRNVLDVGCASGYLGVLLAADGCTVVGVESDIEAAAVAKSSGAYQAVHTIDLDHAASSLPSGTFDVILCADVLEHLRQPEDVLRRLGPLLAAGGRFVISLPNVAHLSVRLELLTGRFRYADTGILDRTHLHFYTHESAQTLITAAGLRVESILSGSDHFGDMLSFGPRPVRWLRGLLAYNIVVVARSASGSRSDP
jgi:2-polyprenyl-3-methyl-5-hydroxy-6-metoxy-1,4-benzoquinol methylase